MAPLTELTTFDIDDISVKRLPAPTDSCHSDEPVKLTAYGWVYSWNTMTVPNCSYVLVSEAFNSARSAFSSAVSVTIKN
jgi:hypothetical protein